MGTVATFVLGIIFTTINVSLFGLNTGLVPALLCALTFQTLFFCPPPPECESRPFAIEVALTVFLADLASAVDINNPTQQALIAQTIETAINEADDMAAPDCPTAERVLVNLTISEVTIINENNNNNNNRHRSLQGPTETPILLVLVGLVQSLEAAAFLSDDSSVTTTTFLELAGELLSDDDVLDTPVRVEAVSVGAVVPCPTDVVLESMTATFLITSRNPTSNLASTDMDALIRACVVEYGRLDAGTSSCNPTFLNLQGCAIGLLEEEGRRQLKDEEEDYEISDDRSSRRRLSVNSGLRFNLAATGYTRPNQLSPFFSGVRRRRLEENEQEQQHEPIRIPTMAQALDQYPDLVSTTLRSLASSSSRRSNSVRHGESTAVTSNHHSKRSSPDEDNNPWLSSLLRSGRRLPPVNGDDICICPISDDQTNEPVDFNDFLTSLNTSVPALTARRGVHVEEQPCSGMEMFELDVPVTLRGMVAASLGAFVRLQIQQLLKETLNTLSFDNCPETFVFVTTVLLSNTPDGGFMATYTGRCATLVSEGTPQCAQEIFAAARRQLQQPEVQEKLLKMEHEEHKEEEEEEEKEDPALVAEHLHASPQDDNGSAVGHSSSTSGFSISIDWDEALLPQRYRRLEQESSSRSLQAVDFPCYCRVGVPVGGVITVNEYNALLTQELSDFVDLSQITSVEVSNPVP